jgi:2'-5' RNA ligase
MRTFISIHPDEETLHKISSIQSELKEKARALGHSSFHALRWEKEDKFHMTLFFVGETDKAISDAIAGRLSEVADEMNGRTMSISTGAVNAFPNLRFPRVLVLEMLEKEGILTELSMKIRTAMLEFGLKEDKPFRPHITLARVRRDVKLNLTGLDLGYKDHSEFISTGFCYYQSTLQPGGSVYSKLKEYSLA